MAGWHPAGPGQQGPDAQSKGALTVDPDVSLPPAGNKMFGTANWGGIQRLLDMYNGTGAQNGLYRIKLYTHRPNPAEDPAYHLRLVKQAGHRVLLTCKGTPLEMATDKTEWDHLDDEYPPYARSMPEDPQAYADYLVSLLFEMHTLSGFYPDYVEIWAEPDRPEHWSGSLEDLMLLYETIARTIRSDPALAGIALGGLGMAGAFSDMGGSQSVLLELTDRAANQGWPLDFLSWHHYTVGSEMRQNRITSVLRDRLQQHHLPEVELIISEWNIFPSAENNPDALGFDGPHSAANFAAVISVILEQDIDGHTFFQLHDVDEQQGIADLLGHSVGAITRHGVKKPVFRLMELINPMANLTRLATSLPEDEFSLSIMAFEDADKIRLVVANDVVDPEWLWSVLITERTELLPGIAWKMLIGAGYAYPQRYPKVQALEAQGMSRSDAEAILGLLPEVEMAVWRKSHPRHVQLEVANQPGVQIQRVWTFDDYHNNPLLRREELLPFLEMIEFRAVAAAEDAAEAVLLSYGVPPPPGPPKARNPEELAIALGVELEVATEVWIAYWVTLHEERLAPQPDFEINNLPATVLQADSAQGAGIRVMGNTLIFPMLPNSVRVIDIDL